MTIGVGVEGPSDRIFWDKVLHKHFRHLKFDIRNMKSRDKLIRETPQLMETFRDAHYRAGFILVDRDESPCVTAIIDAFDTRIQREARKPIPDRYLFICVAIRELEAWFLADALAIAAVLPQTRYHYHPPVETGHLNAEARLNDLWQEQHGQVAFNKIDFAKRMAPEFKPNEASHHSRSFAYFWKQMTLKARL